MIGMDDLDSSVDSDFCGAVDAVIQDEEEEHLRLGGERPREKAPGRGKGSLKLPLATCQTCTQKFTTMDGYKSHLMLHFMEGKPMNLDVTPAIPMTGLCVHGL